MDSSDREWKSSGLVKKDSLNESRKGQEFSTTEFQSEDEESEMDRGTDRPGQGRVIRDWKLNSNVECRVTVERMEASGFKSEMERHTDSQVNEMKLPLVKRECTAVVKNGTGNESFKCHICSKMFRWPSTLEIHVRIHYGVKSFTCHVCKRGFLRRDHLKSHSFLHPKEKPYECDVCRLGFTQKKIMKFHKKKCQNARNLKPSVSKSKIKINGIRKRKRTKFHKCNVCSRKYDSPSELKSHTRTHTGEKPFICAICKCRFGWLYSLERHSIVHTGLQRFKCDICDRSFGLKHSMLRHRMRLHTGKNVYIQSRESDPTSDQSESRDVRPSTSTPPSDSSDKPCDPEERAQQWTSFLKVFNVKMAKK